jgi:hypothetical protein
MAIMRDGVIPGTFSSKVLSTVPNTISSDDTKKENRRKSLKYRDIRTSFADWLRMRARAEEEELWDTDDTNDDNDEDLEDAELDDIDDEDYDSGCDDYDECDYDDNEDDPEEFDDFDEEKELEFDDEEHERAPFPLPHRDDDGFSDISAGRFKDFYRMSAGEEEQEEAPGGFTPGEAVGTIGGMGSDVPKIERARILMRQLVNNPNVTRDDIIEQFIKRLPTTEETAKSYYEDIAREMGLNKKDDDIGGLQGGEDDDDDDEGPVDELPGDTTQELSQEEIDAQDPNSQGIIRTVTNAHLVFKRQMEDGKFEELWIYNIGGPKKESSKIEDSLSVRREILSGTDIPRGHTKSEDGQQAYTLHTMGNAQLLHITGLAN